MCAHYFLYLYIVEIGYEDFVYLKWSCLQYKKKLIDRLLCNDKSDCLFSPPQRKGSQT
jgi:hypothetical protein